MLATRISLPTTGARPGGLLRSSRSLDEFDWWRGITFESDGCLSPERVGPCPVAPVTGVPETPGDAALFSPLTVRQGVICSAMSGFNLEALATESLAATAEFALGQELVDGLGTENPNLSDATSIGSVGSVPDALGCLEEAAAVGLAGRAAVIHVPPAATAHLPNSVARGDDGIWRTAAGSTVVSSPGYAGQAFLWATGEVFAATGFAEANSALDRSDNTDVAWADQLAIAAFDPCWTAKVGVTLPDCTP